MSKWVKVKLGSICLISKGEQLNKLDLEKAGEFPCINGGILPSGFTDNWNTEANTITISEGGNSCGFVNFQTKRFWSGGHCYSLLELKETIYNNFLFQVLKGNESSIMSLRVGSGLPNIQQKSIRDFELIIPENLTEQRQIATILSTADAVIEKTQAAIDKYKAIKQGMLQDLFTRGIDITTGKLRPSYQDAPELYKESKLGWIPKEWEVEEIKELIKAGVLDDIQDGNHGEIHPKSNDFVSVGIPFVMASDISKDKIDFDNCNKISREQYLNLRIGFSKEGDILLSHKASIGFVAKVPLNMNEIMLTPQVTYYRILNENVLNCDYLEFFLRSDLFQVPLHNFAKQSTRDYIGITMQKNLRIAYPYNIEEQNLISEKLISIYNKLQTEHDFLHKQEQIKAGLMNDLLSGKKRVVVKEGII